MATLAEHQQPARRRALQALVAASGVTTRELRNRYQVSFDRSPNDIC